MTTLHTRYVHTIQDFPEPTFSKRRRGKLIRSPGVLPLTQVRTKGAQDSQLRLPPTRGPILTPFNPASRTGTNHNPH